MGRLGGDQQYMKALKQSVYDKVFADLPKERGSQTDMCTHASHLQSSRTKAVTICVPQPLAFRNTSHSEPSFCRTLPNCRLQTLTTEYVIIQPPK